MALYHSYSILYKIVCINYIIYIIYIIDTKLRDTITHNITNNY